MFGFEGMDPQKKKREFEIAKQISQVDQQRCSEIAKQISYGNRRFTFSSIAQSVEHAAVNRSVVGSSPTGGGKK